MPRQHQPAEFAEILNSPARPLIIGGQAINIWAEYYSVTNPRLAAQRPFVSKDADIYGDRAMAETLAQVPGWKVTYFHEPRTIAGAVLSKEVAGKATLTVEVLWAVRGLTRRELEDSDLVELRPGQVYRIPSPIRLLKAKLANLHEIRPSREQDIHHAQLLVSLAHDYLQEQHRHVMAGRLSERQWVNAFHELRDVIRQPAAQNLNKQFGLELDHSIPAAVSHAGLPKIAALYQHLRETKRPGPRLSP
jgi:hypothetical protein